MGYQIISIVLLVVTVIVSLLSYYLYIRGKIMAAAAGAINDSEIDDVEGEKKLELAVEQICALIPAVAKPFFSCEFVRQAVQAAFDKIEEYAKKQVIKKGNSELK